jgi:hypothetical protein
MKRTGLFPAVVAAIAMVCSVSVSAQGHAEKTIAPGLVRYQNQQVVRLPDDTLKSFYLGSRDGSQLVLSKASKDNGESWNDERRLLALPPGTQPFEGMWALLANDGRVHLFFYKESGIWHSQPAASTWSAPLQIFAGHPGVLRGAVELPGGRLVLPFYYAVHRNWWDGTEKGLDRFAFMGNYVVSTLYSDDSGATWQQSPEVIKIPTPSLGQNGAVDPAVLLRKDGTVWMLVSNQRGWLYETFSRDGVHWSENHPSRFISSDGPAAITRLKDGRIALVWNECLRFPYLHGGVYVLHAAISDGDGNSWRGYREIYRDPYRADPAARGAGYGAGFPTVAATADGKLLVHAGQGKSQTTLLFDPKALYEPQQRDDFSHGLDAWSVFGTKGVGLVDDPGRPGAKALSLRRVDETWPAAAVWNFPAGQDGKLVVRLRLNHGFQGAHLSLTDHFSVPFDPEAELNAVYVLSIAADGRIATGERLQQDRWYNVELSWNSRTRKCAVSVDGRHVGSLPQLKLTDSGVNYLRLHSTSERADDGGFVVQSVSAEVKGSDTASPR